MFLRSEVAFDWLKNAVSLILLSGAVGILALFFMVVVFVSARIIVVLLVVLLVRKF